MKLTRRTIVLGAITAPLAAQAQTPAHDLLAMGYRPGPRFREILSAVEDAQLEGLATSREQAVELVRREFPLSQTG